MSIKNKNQGVTPFVIKSMLSAIALTTSAAAVNIANAASNNNYDGLSKQLAIMNNIFSASLKAQENKRLRATKIDSLYLAGQGVVFTVNSSTSAFFSNHNFNFVYPDIVEPIAPIAPIEQEVEFEFFSDDEEITIEIESDHEDEREHYHELKEQQRDLAYQLRDIARESKDIAYQLRTMNKDEQTRLKEEQTKLQAEKKALAKQKQALEVQQKKLSKTAKKMKAKQKERVEKRAQQREQHFALLTTSLVETICSYGNSLKALPKNEHVSLVVKSAGDKEGRRGYKDQVYVFNKKDIAACSSDQSNPDKLILSAKNYQF